MLSRMQLPRRLEGARGDQTGALAKVVNKEGADVRLHFGIGERLGDGAPGSAVEHGDLMHWAVGRELEGAADVEVLAGSVVKPFE